MGFFGNCTSCTIVSDDFGDGVLTGWNQVSGTWTESGGIASITVGAGTFNVMHRGNIGGTASFSIEVKVRGDRSYARLGIIFDYDDANNYKEAYVNFDDSGTGSSCARLTTLEVIAGVVSGGSTAYGTAPINQWHKLLVCYKDAADGGPSIAAKLVTESGETIRVIEAPCTAISGSNIIGVGASANNSLATPVCDFDDFKHLKPAGFNCCCPNCDPGCLQDKDDFDTSPTCKWTISNGSITGGEMKLTVAGGVAATATGGASPSPGKVSIKIKLPANSSKASIAAGNAKVEITADDGAGGCGALAIYLSGVLQGWSVPISSLPAGVWHTLTICFKSGIFSTTLTTAAGASYGHHQSIAGGGTIVLGTGTTNGDYYFDEFRAWKLQDISDEDLDDCPCCSLGCEVRTDEFSTGSAPDCNWSSVAGTWTVSGGAAQTTSSNARLIHQSSWTGLDDDCETDNTVRLEATAQSTAFSDQLLFIFDYLDSSNFHYALVDLASDDIGSGAALSLYKRTAGADSFIRSEGFSGALRNTDITVTVCYDQSTINVTGVAGAVTTTFESASTGHGGKRTGLGTGTITGTAKFLSFSKNHNLYSSDCADCLPTQPCEVNCTSGTAPGAWRVRLTGFAGDLAGLNGTYILPFTHCDSAHSWNVCGGGLSFDPGCFTPTGVYYLYDLALLVLCTDGNYSLRCNGISLVVGENPDGTWYVSVSIGFCGNETSVPCTGFANLTYRRLWQSTAAPVDCFAVPGGDVPYYCVEDNNLSGGCLGKVFDNGTTCAVSAADYSSATVTASIA